MKAFAYSALASIILIMLLPSGAAKTVRVDLISQCALDVNARLPAGEMVGAMPERIGRTVTVKVTDYDGHFIREESCTQ